MQSKPTADVVYAIEPLKGRISAELKHRFRSQKDPFVEPYAKTATDASLFGRRYRLRRDTVLLQLYGKIHTLRTGSKHRQYRHNRHTVLLFRILYSMKKRFELLQGATYDLS